MKMEKRLTLALLMVMMMITVISTDDHPAASQSDDQHLHESQIPPPYQQPSQEDVNAMLSKVFELIDKNNDQKVDADELKQWLDTIHSSLISDNVQQQWTYYSPPVQEVHSWESYDPEQKEALTWDHYINATYTEDVVRAYRENADVDQFESQDPNFRSYYTMMKRAERRWKVADNNNDTVLVKEEFKYFLHPEEADHTKYLLVEEAMDDMDSDGNREISLEEYMKHMKDVTPEQEKQQDANFESNHQSQFQTYLDKNKDGNLSIEELSEWLIPNYDRHEAEATRMIQETDSDHDQKLQLQDIVGNNQYFLSLIPAEMWREYAEKSSTTAPHDEF